MGDNDAALKAARKTIDVAIKAIDETRTELIRVKRELTEILGGERDPDDVPTVRPPSGEHQAVELPKVEIVKIPKPGRY